MSTLTQEEQEKLSQFLSTRNLCAGLGDTEISCSIGTINLLLTGELTARVPDFMSVVIGGWIIPIQDLMPNSIRNSPKWKQLLVLSTGTGREKEKEEERFAIIAEWFWTTVLPCFNSAMDKFKLGAKWQETITTRDEGLIRELDRDLINLEFDYVYFQSALRSMLWSLLDFIEYGKYGIEHKAGSILRIGDTLKVAKRLRPDCTTIEQLWDIIAPCELLEKLVNV